MTWDYYYLRFPDESTATTALTDFDGMTDVIGGIEGNSFYHVNIAIEGELPDALKQYVISPDFPKRIWATDGAFVYKDANGNEKEFIK